MSSPYIQKHPYTQSSYSLSHFILTYSWQILIALFLITRLILIFYGYQAIHCVEDQEQGYIAIEFLSGLRAPLINYQTDSYTGGTLITGLFAVPFIYFLGLSMFSLKMLALCFSLCGFILMLFLMNRFVDRRAALYAGLLWIFAPPIVTHSSLMLLGSHERLFPALAFLTIFCLTFKTQRFHFILWLSLGALTGWAMAWSYINLVVITACFINACITKGFPKLSLPTVITFILGFAAGSAQWLIYNIEHEFGGLTFLFNATIFRPGAVRSVTEVLSSPIRFITKDLPYGLSFQSIPGLSGKFQNYFYFSIAAWIISYSLIRTLRFFYKSKFESKKILIHFLEIYLLIYPVFYIFCGYSYDAFLMRPSPWVYRYLVPYYGFGLLYLAILLTRIKFRKIILGLLLFMGLSSQIAVTWGQPFGEVFNVLAFKSGLSTYVWKHREFADLKTLRDFEHYMQERYHLPENELANELSYIANSPIFWSMGTPQELVRIILQIPKEKYRRYFFRKWGRNIELSSGNVEAMELVKTMLRVVPSAYQRDLIFGIGRGFSYFDGNTIDQMLQLGEKYHFSDPSMFYFSLGTNFFRAFRNGKIDQEYWEGQLQTITELKADQKKWISRGMGTAMYRSFRFQEILDTNFSLVDGKIARADLAWGVGFYLGRRYYRRPKTGHQRIRLLAPELQEQAHKGFHYFHHMSLDY